MTQEYTRYHQLVPGAASDLRLHTPRVGRCWQTFDTVTVHNMSVMKLVMH